MKEIKLTRGKVALVSDHRFEYLNQFKWQFRPVTKGTTVGYAQRGAWNKETKKEYTVLMHNEIMNPPKGKKVDHLNRYGLDNQDENLEVKTQANNLRNRGLFKNNKAGIRGVHFNPLYGKYRVMFQRYFHTKEEAGDVFKKIEEFVDSLYPNRSGLEVE